MTTLPPDGPGSPDDEGAPLTEEEIAAFMAQLGGLPEADQDTAPESHALVFTPAASATDLARLCRVAGIDTIVVPTSTGALATRHLAPPAPRDDWDISELLDGPEGLDTELPAEARALAEDVSRVLGHPVVLVVATLATDVGPEAGLSGHVSAVRFEEGRAVGEMSPGLLLAHADDVAEDLVLGRLRPAAVPGAVDAATVPLAPRGRGFFGRRRGDGPAPEER